MSTRRLVLPVYVDLDGGGKFFSPAWDSLAVEGAPAVASLDVFAPSVVAPGERFTLAIRAADRWFNRPTGAIPGWEVRLDGKPVATVPAGGRAIAEVAGLTLRELGVARFEVRSADGRLSARSNPIWVREKGSDRIFWGELHGHTDFAEAQGTPEEYYVYGTEDARLDFLALTEHDGWLDAAEWRTLQRLATAANDEGRAIAFLAYEWTAQRSTGGHHNVIFRHTDSDLVPFAEAPTLPELYRGLHAEAAPEDVLVIPHAHTAGDWTRSDPQLERLVEMYSMHGTFEWFANLYLANGWEVGFVGGSDDHRGKPGLARSSYVETLGQRGGLAAAIVPEKKSDAIFDALRRLSSYATSGQRMLLDADLNGFGMGTRQPAAEQRKLHARVAGTAPIDRIDVVKNGEIVFSRDYATAALAPKAWVLVGFESSSEVFPPPSDSPRLYRVWEGTLDVAGAARRDARHDRHRQSLHRERDARSGCAGATALSRRDPRAPRRLPARARRRERRHHLLVRRRAGPRDRSRRRPGAPAGAEHPAGALHGPAGRARRRPLRARRHVRALRRPHHACSWSTSRPARSGARVDRPRQPAHRRPRGDYYYLRVNQLDGARAWSSPWWVGGRAARRQRLDGARRSAVMTEQPVDDRGLGVRLDPGVVLDARILGEAGRAARFPQRRNALAGE